MTRKPSNGATVLIGIAFEVADLVLLQGWANRHGMRMAVELDQCIDGHEYEEIIAIYASDVGPRRWSIWRSRDGVIAQPLLGRARRFFRVADATEALLSVRLRYGPEKSSAGDGPRPNRRRITRRSAAPSAK